VVRDEKDQVQAANANILHFQEGTSISKGIGHIQMVENILF
jgi:hypothetical protein